MGDFMDFSHTLENISTLCTGDKQVVYTLINAFDYPHSHRVHGELQTGDGQVTGALHLCPDFDDKHLVWPVKLEFKLLAYMNGNTEVLGTREMIWDVTNVNNSFEDISRRNSITFSLQDLKEKDMIGADDSVTFFWSVKLSYPKLQDLQSAASTSDIALKEAVQGSMKSKTDTNVATNLEHRPESKTYCDRHFQRSAIIVFGHCNDKEQIQDREENAELKNIAAEMIRLYSIDMIPHSMSLDKDIPKFFQKQIVRHDMTEKNAGILFLSSIIIDEGDSSLTQTTHQDPEPQFKDAPHFDVTAPGPAGLSPETVRMLLEGCNKFSFGSKKVLTPLMHESYCGDPEKVLSSLEDENPDINIQGPWGMTALMFASWTGQDKSVQFLLEQKADVNMTNDLGMSALMIATMRGHTEIVRLLLENNADANIMAGLKFHQTEEMIHSMSPEAKQKFSQLMSCRLTCLIIAAARDERRIVNLLLDHLENINTETANGTTALKAACRRGHSEIVGDLLDHGAVVNMNEERGTSLTEAFRYGHLDVVKLLLQKHSRVTKKDVLDAVLTAHKAGSSEVLRILLADLSKRHYGKTLVSTKFSSAQSSSSGADITDCDPPDFSATSLKARKKTARNATNRAELEVKRRRLETTPTENQMKIKSHLI